MNRHLHPAVADQVPRSFGHSENENVFSLSLQPILHLQFVKLLIPHAAGSVESACIVANSASKHSSLAVRFPSRASGNSSIQKG